MIPAGSLCDGEREDCDNGSDEGETCRGEGGFVAGVAAGSVTLYVVVGEGTRWEGGSVPNIINSH